MTVNEKQTQNSTDDSASDSESSTNNGESSDSTSSEIEFDSHDELVVEKISKKRNSGYRNRFLPLQKTLWLPLLEPFCQIQQRSAAL